MPADPELVKASNNIFHAFVGVFIPAFGILFIFTVVWTIFTGQLNKMFTKLEQKIFRKKGKEGKCPWCGGELIKKSGKFGPFIGCSNYSRCKYTSNKNT